MPNAKLTKKNAVLLLETTLIREIIDLQGWDLRQMKNNVLLMKRVIEKTKWGTSEKSASLQLKLRLNELQVIIQNRDATRVDAGHTHVEQALSDLRNNVFGV